MISDGYRLHAVSLGLGKDVFNTTGTVKQTVFRVVVQMRKWFLW
jgi:hypothetical protein